MNAGKGRDGYRKRRQKCLERKKIAFGQGRVLEGWVKMVWPEEWRGFTAGRQQKYG